MTATDPLFDPAGQAYQQTRMAHWDTIARKRDTWHGMGRWYHNRLQEIYRFHVNPNQKVLEIGCAEGHLLAALQPARGVGVDFSDEMLQRATKNYPHLEFICADAHDLSQIQEKFDVIVLSDLVNDLWDVQQVFEQIKPLCHPRTRVLMNFYTRLCSRRAKVAAGRRNTGEMVAGKAQLCLEGIQPGESGGESKVTHRKTPTVLPWMRQIIRSQLTA